MDSRLRMLDANANRAREALRVLEDVARFALDDDMLCGELKAARHDLRTALDQLPEGAGASRGLAWRDTPGDVGTEIATTAEGHRSGLRDVATAAGKRLSEALRVLEECAKTVTGEGAVAATLESLRYRGYELERRVLAAFATGRGVQWRLCVLISERLCTHRSWQKVALAAMDGGADCLQLREKTLDGAELLRRARWLVSAARERGQMGTHGEKPAIVVNDRADIAMLAGADGVHVGQEDLSVRDVRRLAGDSLLVGVSTHDIEQARRAAEEGADVCGVGPMFPTSTKDAGPLAGPEYLRAYLADPRTARLPHLAIGGITVERARELASVGCRGIAVSSAICGAPDPAAACRALLDALIADA